MASPAYTQLLVVQGHDTLIDQLRHRHTNHPIRAELDDLGAQASALDSEISEIESRRHDLDRERKRLDDEAAKIQAKRDDINVKLYDGSVTATKDLIAMQEEAKSLAGRQGGIEDEELEFMEQLEVVGAELDTAQSKRQALADQQQTVTGQLEEALAEIDGQVAAEIEVRTQAAASVPPEILTAYDQQRADLGGVAVAKLNGTTCEGCHMTLSAVTVDRLRKATDDAVTKCDECGRLLVV